MKILLVDDETKKLGRVKGIINSIQFCAGLQVEHAISLMDARKQLKMNQYVLMVLDLNIPEDIDEDAVGIGGSEFVEEILSGQGYNIPDDIVILTAYDDLHNQFCATPRGKSLLVIKYDESNLEWENIIKAKVEYLYLKEKKKRRSYDYVIITAVDVELQAVKRLFKIKGEFLLQDDPTLYYEAEVNTKKGTKKLLITKLNEMGMVAAASITSKIKLVFSPSIILLVGIAAGLSKKIQLGDILVPMKVWNYSAGKYCDSTAGDSEEVILFPDSNQIEVDPRVRNILERDYSSVLDEISRDWVSDKVNKVTVYLDPMACGTAVVASKTISQKNILDHVRKTAGLDMESYGFMYANKNVYPSRSVALCIKSVSDHGNNDKEDSSQKYASYMSASFAKHLLENNLLEINS